MKEVLWAAALLAAGVLCADPAGPKIKVALAGSSGCQTYESGDPKLIWGWGEVISRFFTPNVTVLNFAVSGQSTRSFRDKGSWAKLLASKPDYIFMTPGANDTPGKPFATDAQTTFRENLRRYAAAAEAAGAKIIFVTLNQSLRGNKKTNKAMFIKGRALRQDRVPYSQAIREAAAELHKPCLELFDNQQKIFEAMGEEAAGKLYRLKPDGVIDGSHTDKAGAELLAKIIISELRKSDSPLKEFTVDPKLEFPAARRKRRGGERSSACAGTRRLRGSKNYHSSLEKILFPAIFSGRDPVKPNGGSLWSKKMPPSRRKAP